MQESDKENHIKAFLDDIKDICVKYGYCICYEGGYHGNFTIIPYNESDMEELENAKKLEK